MTEEKVEEPTETEVKAMELGWKPKDEFDADERNQGKKWRDADDFVDRQSLFDKIDHLSRKNKDLDKGLQALGDHNRRIEELAYKRALDELKADRKVAIEEGDLVKSEEIRDKMDEVKDAQRRNPPPQQTGPDPYVNEWLDKNQWYKTDPDMKRWVDGMAAELLAKGVTDPREALPQIEQRAKEIFKDKFQNPNRARAPQIEGSNGKKGKPDSNELSDFERKIMNQMIRAGSPISEEEYSKQVKKYRGVQ